jgi:hypothetical protein
VFIMLVMFVVYVRVVFACDNAPCLAKVLQGTHEETGQCLFSLLDV